MPSIEIVCIGQRSPMKLRRMPFAVVSDAEPLSHRPDPLFQRELRTLNGCTYHLGNPGADSATYAGAYFAYELLSSESRGRSRGRFFEVATEFRSALEYLIHALLRASPAGALVFFTDWQFGPKRATRGGVLSENEFWKMHDAHELKLNACYTIRVGRPTSRSRRRAKTRGPERRRWAY